MSKDGSFEILLVCVPGLEPALLEEMRALGFRAPKIVAGGVRIEGRWPDVWRANLEVRGASKILARIGSFRASALWELDKQAQKFPWSTFFRNDVPIRVEASCKASKIFHTGAVTERIVRTLSKTAGLLVAEDADLVLKVRIERDVATLSIDTSGEGLHRRGHKQAMAKAPLRETMAANILRLCNYTGQESVVDPMCGSGTFVIEAAEMALGLKPGRDRSFAFEQLKSFDQAIWQKLQTQQPLRSTAYKFVGSDRDAGAIAASIANAKRAGLSDHCTFSQRAVSALHPPDGAPGLVIVNPPYGTRLGDKKPLMALYATLGRVLRARFAGWRVGLVTTDAALAKATQLPFLDPIGPIAHGGLRIKLWRTAKL